MRTLRVFRFYFADANEVKNFIEEIEKIPKEDKGVMISRARQV